MSIQNVIAFLNKANTNTVLSAKIRALDTDSLEPLIALATNEGLPFTTADWQAVKATAFTNDELDEETLNQVVGGTDPLTGILCNGAMNSFPCNGIMSVFSCNGIIAFQCDVVAPNIGDKSLLQRFGK